MVLNTGQIVNGRYRIARLLGRGGMGAVYRAWNLNLNMPVALKEMIPDPNLDFVRLNELRQQFKREAQVLASFSHPNLPRVTDFFEWNSNVYLIMDFIEGASLDVIIERQGPIPQHKVLNWASQLLDALQVCHARNVIHRDIKPHNIIICSDDRAVLVDFGLVKLWDPRQPHTQRIIQGLGTREYSSPEQYGLGTGHTEPRSDIYSLGATLYHALTGQAPVSAIDRLSKSAILKSFQESGVMVNPQIESAVLQSMAMNPEQRFTTSVMMKTALDKLAQPSRTPTYSSFTNQNHTALIPGQSVPYAGINQTPAIPKISTRKTKNRTLNPTWQLELITAIVMAVTGTAVTQAVLWKLKVWYPLLGISIGAIIAGALGWFIGDTIYQALTQSNVVVTPIRTVNRPTQRLVASTRKLMRKLNTLQQIGLLAVLLCVVILTASLLGPVIFTIPILWNNFPSYAIAGAFVYAAVGRKAGMTALTHILVILIGGLVLEGRLDLGLSTFEYLLSGAAGGVFMELVAFISNHLLIKPNS